jgi:outer membrane cobalamin receptor
LDYAIDPNNEFQLNYTRRLNRPRGRSINPFINISDSTNWSFGNPNLAPEYINSFEINYLKSWTSHTLSASLFYHYTTNGIQSVQWLNSNNIMMNTYMNGSKTTAGGLEAVVRDNFFSFFNLTTTLDLYYNKLYASQFLQDNQTINIPEQSSFSWNAKSIANIMLPANLSAQITGSYTAPYFISQGKNMGNYEVDLGLRQMLLHKKFILNLNVRDIFNSNRSKIETWGPNYKQESLNYFNGRMVSLNISYNFGNSTPKRGKKPVPTETNNTNNTDNMMDGM